MIFGITIFTLIHTLLSVIGIFAGLVLAGGLIAGKRLDGWSVLFLVITILTNVTGFGFPLTPLLPGDYIGALSLLILPGLIAAAPTQQEPPFAITQVIVLALFVVLGRSALKGSKSA